MFNKKSLSALAVLLLPMSANAFDYNYAEVVYADVDDVDSGLVLNGSRNLQPNFSLIGSVLFIGDLTGFSIGGAYHQKATFAPNTDLVIHGSIENQDYEVCFGNFCVSDDDSGIALGTMLRHQPQDKLEVFGGLTYTTIWDNDMKLKGGVLYEVQNRLKVGASLELSDTDTLSLGVRYSY